MSVAEQVMVKEHGEVPLKHQTMQDLESIVLQELNQLGVLLLLLTLVVSRDKMTKQNNLMTNGQELSVNLLNQNLRLEIKPLLHAN